MLGEHDEIGLTDHEREVLEQCPSVTLVKIAAGHFTLNEEPGEIADVLLDALED